MSGDPAHPPGLGDVEFLGTGSQHACILHGRVFSLEISSLNHNGEHGLLGVGPYGRPSRLPEGP